MSAQGDRVTVHTVTQDDMAPYRVAVEQSRSRLARWNPVNPDDLAAHLAGQSDRHRTFLVHARRPGGRHGIVGKVNVTSVVRGRLSSAAMGYDAYNPYAGTGMFAEGMRLVLDLAFAAAPTGMALHRVEANVQPGNVTSAGLLRSLGFRREGHSLRLMWLRGADGQEAWRDHDLYALTREEWPAPGYAGWSPPRALCLVGGPGASRTELARMLARELAVPMLSEAVVGPEALWPLLADSVAGAVLEGRFTPHDAPRVRAGLRRAGVDPADAVEVWCPGPVPADRPLALGPVHQVGDRAPTPREVTGLALAVRAAARPGR